MNYQLEQTGDQVQSILNQAPTTEQDLRSEITRSTNKDEQLETAIGNEQTRAEGAEGLLQTSIGNEQTRAEGVEGELQAAISNEKTRAEGVEGGLRTDVDGINAKIPAAASAENKLADKDYVNSSIATNTADFKGTYSTIEELQAVLGANANDYAFVIMHDAAGNTAYWRYKYVEGTDWVFEYALNNSSFTSDQWAAINSAITAALVAKLLDLPTAASLTQQLNAIIASVADEKTRAEGVEAVLREDIADNATAIGNEKTRAEGAEGLLQTAIGNEKGRAEGAEVTLQQNIDEEAILRGNADETLQGNIDAINEKIPAAASSSNQLADKAFVNSSISTNTAEFKGTYNSLAELQQVTANANDYGFVVATDAAGNTVYNRYKYVAGTGWVFEYALNNSSFTSDQWAAINSGITALLVAKLSGLPDADALATMFAAKQNVLTFDDIPNQNSSNPVKSGGVYSSITNEALTRSDADTALVNAINAINGKIPSAAAADNQLADKAWVAAQILANIEAFKGQFTTLAELQAVSSPKSGDLGIVRTKDSDGHDVFTFYQYLSNAWNVFYSLSYHPQLKPATTGTTGDYPYNGMGRVELAKNIVNGVNTLTQDMFYKGAVGSRAPNTNTIFVIQYDYTLGEDITVPANCVLEFDGGSISGAYTLTGANTGIEAGLVKIFNTDVIFAGTWNIVEIYPECFGAKGDNIADDTNAFHALAAFVTAMDGGRIYIPGHTYKITEAIYMKGNIELYGCGRNSVLHLANSNTGIHIGDVNDFTLVNAYLTDGEGTIAGKTSGGGDVTCKCTVKGDTVVKVSDASKFEINELYVIQDLCDFSFDNSRCYYRQGEIIRVKSKDTTNNTITLYNGLYGVYGNDNYFEGYVSRPAAERDNFEQRFLTSIDGYAHRTVFFKYDFKKVNLHDFKVYAEGDNSSTVSGYYGLYISNIINSRIENIEVINEGCNHVAMRVDGAYQSVFSNSRVYSDFGYEPDRYGFSLGDIQDFVISGCTFGGREHCLATGSKAGAGAIINRNFIYERINVEPIHPSANGNTIVIDVHEGAELYTYRNINIPSYSCDLGGYYMTVENCSFNGITTGFFRSGLSVRNCKAVSFGNLTSNTNPWHDYSNDRMDFENLILNGDFRIDFQASAYPIDVYIRNCVMVGIDLRNISVKTICIENCDMDWIYCPTIRYTGGTDYVIKGNKIKTYTSFIGNKLSTRLFISGNHFEGIGYMPINANGMKYVEIEDNYITTTTDTTITITAGVSCLIKGNQIKYGSRRWLYALCSAADANDCVVNVALDNFFIDTPYNATQTYYNAVINFLTNPW